MNLFARREAPGLYSDTFFSGKNATQDLLKGSTYFREQQFSAIWQKIVSGVPHFNVRNILEIGPGAGGETRALQQLHPQAKITAIDFDRRAERAAARNRVDYIHLDLTNEGTPEIINRLVSSRQINTVVAFRTSGSVAANLIKWWDHDPKGKLLAISLFLLNEDLAKVSEVQQRPKKRKHKQIYLANNGRLYDETVMTFIH